MEDKLRKIVTFRPLGQAINPLISINKPVNSTLTFLVNQPRLIRCREMQVHETCRSFNILIISDSMGNCLLYALVFHLLCDSK